MGPLFCLCMRFGAALLLAASALFAVTFTVRATPVATRAYATGAQSPSSDSSLPSDYVGSAACARCHQEAYDEWKRSLHVRMTKPIAEAEVLGDFSGARLSAHGRAFEFGGRDKPFMRVAFGDRPAQTFSVDYTLGFKRYQGYLSLLPDGRMYVLPAFWHVETRRWLDWKEITPVPDGAHDMRQIWNSNCFNCHATNLAQGFDAAQQRYRTTWTEMGIGCEACHGPGKAHVDVIETALKDPSLKPGGGSSIYNSPYGTPRQSFDTCAYCHGNKQNVFANFRAGGVYEDYALPFIISSPVPETDRQGEFWPDGRPSRFNRSQALMQSGCFKAGAVACTSCHAAHGSPYPFSLRVDITKGAEGDTLCTQCHTGLRLQAPGPEAADRGLQAPGLGSQSPDPIERHTFHAANSAGSRCINCHMSDVNWRLLSRRRDHTFQAPVPEITAAFGTPNACTSCHDDEPPEWAARWMDKWWDNGDRRRAALAVADTIYRAASGDPDVVAPLARLAVDRTQSAVIRASALEFLEQLALGTAGARNGGQSTQTSFYGSDPGAAPRRVRRGVELTHNQINALIGAASDPEPMVRARAVTALLATGQRDRIIMPLTARLVDSVRTVRVRAAEALLSLGIVELPGAAGDALARAFDEFAQGLNEFNDVAANHAALGWLEAERGRYAAAEAALDRATKMDPGAPRPWVVRGVMAAREGKLGEAVSLWKKARSLDPAYPMINELIAEAEKRR
jgi:predicted CXXCH cytochrome family protein